MCLYVYHVVIVYFFVTGHVVRNISLAGHNSDSKLIACTIYTTAVTCKAMYT